MLAEAGFAERWGVPMRCHWCCFEEDRGVLEGWSRSSGVSAAAAVFR
jgi:hypothetical protein